MGGARGFAAGAWAAALLASGQSWAEEATGEDLSRFTPADDLMAELVIDSLAALRVLALVEHRFGVRFPDDRLGDFHSLGGLMALIESHDEVQSCASA